MLSDVNKVKKHANIEKKHVCVGFCVSLSNLQFELKKLKIRMSEKNVYHRNVSANFLL